MQLLLQEANRAAQVCDFLFELGDSINMALVAFTALKNILHQNSGLLKNFFKKRERLSFSDIKP